MEGDQTLTVPEDVTLTVDGALKIEEGGSITNNGEIRIEGSITGADQVTGDGTLTGKLPNECGGLLLDGGELGVDYTYDPEQDLVIILKSGASITAANAGTGPAATSIQVAEGVSASLTLTNVTMAPEGGVPLAVEEGASLTLTLSGQNTLTGDLENQGTLTVKAGQLTVEGDVVGPLTANGGEVTVTGSIDSLATGSSGGALVRAGSITDTSGSGSWKGIVFQGTEGQSYGSPTLSGGLTVAADETLTIPSGQTATVKGAVDNQGSIQVDGILFYGRLTGNPLTGSGKWAPAADSVILGGLLIVGGKQNTDFEYTDYDSYGRLSIKKSTPLTISNVDPSTPVMLYLVVGEGVSANLTFNGVYIRNATTAISGFEILGSLNLTLADGSENRVLQNVNKPNDWSIAGIEVAEGASLTIGCAHSGEEGHVCGASCGTLSVEGCYYGAAIGGTYAATGEGTGSGPIVINGGNINASGQRGAGIGGQDADITINGGNVTAYGSNVGIGSYALQGDIENCSITIKGGTVNATCGTFGVGIGALAESGTVTGTIEITGGHVTTAGIGNREGDSGDASLLTECSGDAFLRLTDDVIYGTLSTDDWQCLVMDPDGNITTYGNTTMTEDLVLESGKTFTVSEGTTLTIKSTVNLAQGTVDNNGTIIVVPPGVLYYNQEAWEGDFPDGDGEIGLGTATTLTIEWGDGWSRTYPEGPPKLTATVTNAKEGGVVTFYCQGKEIGKVQVEMGEGSVGTATLVSYKVKPYQKDFKYPFAAVYNDETGRTSRADETYEQYYYTGTLQSVSGTPDKTEYTVGDTIQYTFVAIPKENGCISDTGTVTVYLDDSSTNYIRKDYEKGVCTVEIPCTAGSGDQEIFPFTKVRFHSDDYYTYNDKNLTAERDGFQDMVPVKIQYLDFAEDVTVTLDQTEFSYTGQPQQPTVSVYSNKLQRKLTAEEYSVTSAAQTAVGSYQIAIAQTASSIYGDSGPVTETWSIVPADLTAEHLTFTAPADLSYDGTAKKAAVELKDTYTGAGTITVHYYSDPERSQKLDEAPTLPGTYYVGVTATAGTNFNAAETVIHGDDWVFTIGAAKPTITATTDAEENTVGYSDGVLVTVKVEAVGVLGTPTGTVKLTSETTDIRPGKLVDGQSGFSISGLAVGEHTFTVEYRPEDDNYQSASTTLKLTITVKDITEGTTIETGAAA